MRQLITIILLCFVFVLQSACLYSQTTEKQAQKELKDKAIKEARKEAKKWRKKGFTNLPGDLPLDKQFESSLMNQYMEDENGHPMYIITMGSAVAGSEGVAAANAMDNARLSLAGQIQSEVSALISNNKANTQYENGELETIDEFIANSKTLIQKELGALKPVIRMFREVGDNVEYRYATVYSLQTAKLMTKKIMKDGLIEKMDANEAQLNKLLGL